jgi:hypothetical protein
VGLAKQQPLVQRKHGASIATVSLTRLGSLRRSASHRLWPSSGLQPAVEPPRAPATRLGSQSTACARPWYVTLVFVISGLLTMAMPFVPPSQIEHF